MTEQAETENVRAFTYKFHAFKLLLLLLVFFIFWRGLLLLLLVVLLLLLSAHSQVAAICLLLAAATMRHCGDIATPRLVMQIRFGSDFHI